MAETKYGKPIADSQCWHWCPKKDGHEGHDWCHELTAKIKTLALDSWIKICPQHRQDWEDIT